jgi:hypothetical protein
MRVKPRGNDDDIGGKGIDPAQTGGKRVKIGVVAGAARQRQVQVRALPRALPALLRMAPEEGIEPCRIGMDRHRQNVAAGIEHALGAVAVMHVDIEDRGPQPGLPQPFGGNACIVEETEPAGEIGKGMVARGRHSA